jgi:hypothetical protein
MPSDQETNFGNMRNERIQGWTITQILSLDMPSSLEKNAVVME